MRTNFVGVEIENTPGSIGRVAGILGTNGINVTGFFVGEGTFWFQCDNYEGALSVLDEGGFNPTPGEFLGVELPNTPGAFGGLCSTLGGAGINLHGTYGCVGSSTPTGTVWLHVDNVEAAIPVIEGYVGGMTLAPPA